ncbi:11846_t:CDS:2, partial [Gigaspora rosea]
LNASAQATKIRDNKSSRVIFSLPREGSLRLSGSGFFLASMSIIKRRDSQKYNLLAESNPLQLCAHAGELGTMLPDWKARKDVKEALHRRLFKENQIEALVPNNKKKRLTIKKRAQKPEMYLAETKNDVDKEIVGSSSHLSQFRKELAEAGIDPEQINTYAKLPNVTRASNKIQKRKLEQGLIRLRRLQNICTTETPTLQNLADVIMMLSMRPAEATTLRIIYYKPDESNPPECYNLDYSWYYTGYIKNKGEAKNNSESRPFLSMEKNPEHAKELLTWIQDAIPTRKLQSCKHASRVHGGQNSTSQHLAFLSRIAMRHKIGRHDSGMYYAEGDTSDSDLDSDPEPELETLAPIPKPINENTSEIEDIYDLYGNI